MADGSTVLAAASDHSEDRMLKLIGQLTLKGSQLHIGSGRVVSIAKSWHGVAAPMQLPTACGSLGRDRKEERKTGETSKAKGKPSEVSKRPGVGFKGGSARPLG